MPGPGTELKKILDGKWFRLAGIKDLEKQDKPCKCGDRADYMDKHGSDWCERNLERLAKSLRAEHRRQKIKVPFSMVIARKLIRRAIRRARNIEEQAVKIASAVITSPRPVSYLIGTVRSLQQAGFTDVTIFADSPQNEICSELLPFIGVQRTESKIKERTGPVAMFRWALQHMLESENTLRHDLLIVFQDDIRVARGLKAWIQNEWERFDPAVGVISLFCLPFQLPNNPGWHKLRLVGKDRKAEPISGACALAMPRRSAERFLEESQWSSRTMIDLAVAEWCRQFNMDYLRHHPSLVEHIGAISAIDPRRQVDGTLEQVDKVRRAAEFCDNCQHLSSSLELEAAENDSSDR